MAKILITGVAGFIGSNLAKSLVVQGHQVLGIDSMSASRLPPCRAEMINILDGSDLSKCFAAFRPDVVYHLAARTDLLGKSLEDYSANTVGVKNIIAVSSECSSVKRVIFASSRMVCRIDHVPLNYDDYSAPNFYGKSKVEGEKIVKESAVKFEWVIVRPTSIWGPGFGIPYRNFFDQVRKRRYFHPGNHHPRKSFGYIDNTVFQLASLMEADASRVNRRTFYLGDYDPLDVCVWADYINVLFGFTGRIPAVPMPMLRMAGNVGDVFNKLTGKDRAPLTTFRLNNLITDMIYPQLDELKEVTGPLPFNWQTGTQRTVGWIVAQSV